MIEEEFNLSRTRNRKQFGEYAEEDVKEFIKRLKIHIELRYGKLGKLKEQLWEFIDEIAGNKLNGKEGEK